MTSSIGSRRSRTQAPTERPESFMNVSGASTATGISPSFTSA